MKKKLSLLFSSAFLLLILSMQSCTSDVCDETLRYQQFDPVYMTIESLRNIEVLPANELKMPGKIYVYGDYLFISEQYKGIHIYDNSNINKPFAISFLSIPGNIDMAVRDGYLYADNYIDLLIFDLSDPTKPVLKNHQENVFTKNRYLRPGLGYLVYYEATDIEEVVDCSSSIFGDDIFSRGDVLFSNAENGNTVLDGSGNSTNNGQGGSMARFTLVDNRLYTVDFRDLKVFDVSTPSSPELINTVNAGWGIETIFPSGNNLFLGSTTGLFIFDNTNKDNPTLLSRFNHARVCDPVFVKGNTAYVTLRNGNRCGGFTNQLDVIDISNLQSPKLIKSYQMLNPHGLTILGDKMILCEGKFGLKVLDISNNKKIKEKSDIKGRHFYDAIGLSKDHIILTGDNGIMQYKMEGNKLKELSAINVSKP